MWQSCLVSSESAAIIPTRNAAYILDAIKIYFIYTFNYVLNYHSHFYSFSPTTIQNMCTTNHVIWLSVMVLQGSPYCQTYLNSRKYSKELPCRSWVSSAHHHQRVASLIPIALHLQKLNSHHHLCYASISSSHTINSILDTPHVKNHPPHEFSTSNLTAKQQAKFKSLIKDLNECLTEVTKCFNPLYFLFSPGLRVVDYFSSIITFHSPLPPLIKTFTNIFKTLTKSFVNHKFLLIVLLLLLIVGSKNPMLHLLLPISGMTIPSLNSSKFKLWTLYPSKLS